MADEAIGSEFSRELIIKFPNNPELQNITGEHILQESFTLKEAVCDSEEFKFGGCISSSVEIELLNINPDVIKNKTVEITLRSGIYGQVIFPGIPYEGWNCPSDGLYPGKHYEYYSNAPLLYGRIEDVKRQKDRQISKVTAYDELYYLCNNKNIYSSLSDFVMYSGTSTTFENMGQRVLQAIDSGRDVFPESLKFERNFPGQVNRALSLKYERFKSVFAGKADATEMLRMFCEYSGGFGYLEPYNKKFQIIRFPDAEKTKTITEYSDLSFEEFVTLPFGKYSCQYGDDSAYSSRFGNRLLEYSTYSAENQLLNCIEDSRTDCASGYLEGISQGFVVDYLSTSTTKMAVETFRPFECTMNYNRDIKLGDRIRIKTDYADVPYVESYVLERTIKGISGAMMTISAQGVKKQEESE